MRNLRTPDERFIGLPDFPFEPRYVDVGAGDGSMLRMHYLDEGPPGGEVVLLLHGEPSWSYLYRRIIPVLAAAGLRAVALDLVGFGRSDKPASRADYTYQAHVDWTWAAIEAIGLDAITLVGQDWGGLIGLRLAGEHPGRFARVVAANTFLPAGDRRPSDAFLGWQRHSQETPDFQAGRIVSAGCVTDLTPEVIAAYDAPFPNDTYQAGARQFPLLVPTGPDDPAAPANRAAWESLRRFERPVPVRILRLRCHLPRRRRHAALGHPGGRRAIAHHHPRCRPLPPGRQRRGTRPCHRRLRGRHTAIERPRRPS
jgi:haloalkane dehalogenase